MVNSKEFLSFSIQGRLRLLELYGDLIFEKITFKEGHSVFTINRFYVVVIKDVVLNAVIAAEPVLSPEQLKFYLKL